jgi:hypothetical protein
VWREVEARAGELGACWRGVAIAGGVAVLEGGGEAGAEERGAPGKAEGTGREQAQELDEDGQPDRELDGVLGVAEQAWEVKLALEPAQEKLDLPAPEVDLDDRGGGQAGRAPRPACRTRASRWLPTPTSRAAGRVPFEAARGE